ncbi:MAG: GGDEF domain-containing protein [Desulfobulbaceae bacterium]|nr:GGDEF domain-containing protein [Desulfobulbaceae bacterium]
MTDDVKLSKSLDEITISLRSFIGLSLKKDDKNWAEWINSVAKEIKVRCWEEKGCTKKECPAYKSECGRCWLIAGSLCSSNVTAKGPDGTTNCIDCPVYLANVSSDPCSEIQEQIITLVHNLRFRQIELKEMATHDHLTGLKNRHFFEMYMSHEMEKLKRGAGDMVILMIDVNDFKTINDTCGHVVGDQVLKACAATLNKSIRASDMLFRFGGDEFLIVMSAAGKSEPEILLQRIADNLDDWNSRKNEHDIRLSLSIGYALLTESTDLDEVIDQADLMMYEEKQNYRLAVAKA